MLFRVLLSAVIQLIEEALGELLHLLGFLYNLKISKRFGPKKPEVQQTVCRVTTETSRPRGSPGLEATTFLGGGWVDKDTRVTKTIPAKLSLLQKAAYTAPFFPISFHFWEA